MLHSASVMRSLVWFRNDLRVHDHAALADALDSGEAIAAFVVTEQQWRQQGLGDRRIDATLSTLAAHREELHRLGVPLKILRVDTYTQAAHAIAELASALGVGRVCIGIECPLDERRRDEMLAERLDAARIQLERFNTDTVVVPGDVMTRQGTPYTVFTPFFKNWYPRFTEAVAQIDGRPKAQQSVNITGDSIVAPESTLGWGETEARAELVRFVDSHLRGYEASRDHPALMSGTSRLSRHLTVGSISAREAGALALEAGRRDTSVAADAQKWIGELAWRDFYRHLMYHFDHLSRREDMRTRSVQRPWRYNSDEFHAWCAGSTGYPLVDAGMRQLAAEGWMHNRVRMVTSMFLTKHLLHDWRLGEQYFLEQLFDADFASNNGGWQWSAGTGADAAPYFRIFNPMTQAKKFDPDGQYISRYPADDPVQPIVEHRFARERALAFFR